MHENGETEYYFKGKRIKSTSWEWKRKILRKGNVGVVELRRKFSSLGFFESQRRVSRLEC